LSKLALGEFWWILATFGDLWQLLESFADFGEFWRVFQTLFK
jgi:hypothetical protein